MHPQEGPSAPSRQTNEGDAVAVDPSDEDALPLLRDGRIIGGQHVPWSSNYTFLVRIDAGPGRYVRAIYKPRNGESPLRDFPGGSLYRREYAAYLLSRALGWPPIPLTVVRDGPHGVGAVQLYVDSDPNITYFDLREKSAADLLRFAVFDVVANNADRKGGHCLLGNDGRIWSIDHGLTFHHIFKLRTVMLEFWGARVPRELLDDLEALAGQLESKLGPAAGLSELITEPEMGALLRRIEELLKDAVVPTLDPRRDVPWPLV